MVTCTPVQIQSQLGTAKEKISIYYNYFVKCKSAKQQTTADINAAALIVQKWYNKDHDFTSASVDLACNLYHKGSAAVTEELARRAALIVMQLNKVESKCGGGSGGAISLDNLFGLGPNGIFYVLGGGLLLLLLLKR